MVDHGPAVEFDLPRFGVIARIVPKGVDPATGVMEPPDTKDDVASYDFSPRPGSGCHSPEHCANTVLAGHVDWYPHEIGVFWHLRDLSAGDEVRLRSADGTVFQYRVVSNTTYKENAAPLQEIIGDTPQESVTLLTCDGDFSTVLQDYDSRRVVRAVRQD